MTSIKMPYGKGYMYADIPDEIEVQIMEKAASEESYDLDALLEDAMEHPIGSAKLEELAKPDDTVVIVVNDQTRPGPNAEIVSAIAKRLHMAGVKDNQISVIFATGTHRGPTEEEQKRIVGEENFHRFRMIIHDCRDNDNLVLLKGTENTDFPLYINKAVVDASLCIVTGLIAPHHVAGYSGGRKSIMPGVAGLESLKIHHSFPYYQYDPAMGFMKGNPFHELAVQAARSVGVKFMVNVVQDPHKKFFAFVAGDVVEAHEKGALMCEEKCRITLPKRADIAVASPGGYPRDLDLYQSQKALSVAETLCQETCTFILCAECSSGIGEEPGGNFVGWLKQAKNPKEVIDRYAKEGFNVGSNKAFNFARALVRGRVIIVTDKISKENIEELKLEWAPDLQTAINMAAEGKTDTVMTVIPNAANYIVTIGNESEK